jgi:heme/copper-type cytochrome/quinol oxidase subunit 2
MVASLQESIQALQDNLSNTYASVQESQIRLLVVLIIVISQALVMIVGAIVVVMYLIFR